MLAWCSSANWMNVSDWARFITEHLNDSRRGLNTQFDLADLLRQSVYSRLAGYEDLNDAERLAADPAFRLIASPKIWNRGAALISTLHCGALDAVVLPPVPGQRGALATERPRLQLGESVAAVGVARANRHVVAHEPTATPRQDGRAPGEAWPLLLAPAGRGSPDAPAVRGDAPAHLGAAGAHGVKDLTKRTGERRA